jgi:LacI family repressor for deo operon, udp, cdd, tsx, nupC, and nupG
MEGNVPDSQKQRMVETQRGRPKMADIARLAGVSTATVSRALGGSGLVSEDARRRVERAVEETGYQVNHAASGLRSQRSRQLLVLLPTIANPFFADVVLGVEEEAQAHGYGVLVGSTEGKPEREALLARQLLAGAVDGLVLLTGRRPEGLAGFDAAETRMVAVSERIGRGRIPIVGIDNVAASRAAIEHLLGLGHRRIAHITGPAGSVLTADRLEGYRSALAAADVPASPDLVAVGDFTMDAGEAAMRNLLSKAWQPASRPTSVFCCSDESAIGAIRAAKAHGLRVPADLSVVGFDDIPFAAAYDPALTTVRQPRREMGRLAASLILAGLTGSPARAVRRLPHSLVVRQSSGPAA